MGYRAFLPKPLPPDPPLAFDNEVVSLLERSNLALGRLDGSARLLPNPELFVSMYLRKEAVLSSQIEGTQASLIDLLKYESGIADSDAPGDVSEVVNYIQAVQQGLSRVRNERVTLQLIRDLHKTLLAGGRGADRRPGEFRTVQNWIGPNGGIARAVFVPPTPQDLLPALNDLETFINETTNLPAVVAAGMLHVQFETIHPFIDGNGRTGRLLLTLFLCDRGVLSEPLLYASQYFKVHRAEYYERLQAVRDNGNWEGWIRFFLRGIAEVAEEATKTAGRVIDLRESHRALIAGRAKRNLRSKLALLERLFFRPIVTVRAVEKLVETTFTTAAA